MSSDDWHVLFSCFFFIFSFLPCTTTKIKREKKNRKSHILYKLYMLAYCIAKGVKGLEFLKFFCLISYVLTTPNKQTLIKHIPHASIRLIQNVFVHLYYLLMNDIPYRLYSMVYNDIQLITFV